MLFPGYQPSPFWIPYWICTQHPTCQWSSTSICYHSIPTIHETNALREVLWQRVGKFLLKSTIALSSSPRSLMVVTLPVTGIWAKYLNHSITGIINDLLNLHNVIHNLTVLFPCIQLYQTETEVNTFVLLRRNIECTEWARKRSWRKYL